MKTIITVLPTVILVVTGQMITKWRIEKLSSSFEQGISQFERIKLYITDPYIVSAYGLALLSSVSWMMVVERFDISIAYPIYIALSMGIVILGGVFLFREPLEAGRIVALVVILIGVSIGARYS
jgi:multidrug transporter EmrE-like cation transporter